MANKRETKKERFVRVAQIRTQRVLDDLQSLSKCAASASYEYTDEQLQQIYEAIENGLQEVKNTFAGLNRFSLGEK